MPLVGVLPVVGVVPTVGVLPVVGVVPLVGVLPVVGVVSVVGVVPLVAVGVVVVEFGASAWEFTLSVTGTTSDCEPEAVTMVDVMLPLYRPGARLVASMFALTVGPLPGSYAKEPSVESLDWTVSQLEADCPTCILPVAGPQSEKRRSMLLF